MYFPSSLTLPWSEELSSWDWIKCYTISLSEIRNLFQKQYQVDLQHLQMEWSDWCYWDVSVVTSLVQFVLHELYPGDIVTFKVIHGEYTIKDNTCFQLKPNAIVYVYYCCVHWDWGRQQASLSHKIVIDIVKGTCETIMDPYADAQMDCIYFEVCNCMGSGVADIV